MANRVTRHVRGVPITLEVADLTPDGSAAGPRNYEMWRVDTLSTKEPDTLDWLDSHLRPGDWVYDVGANIGQYSLYAAARMGQKVRVRAFEPEALSYAQLNRNIVANRFAESISAYPLAIADTTGLDSFYVKSFLPGASLHSIGRPVTQGEVAFEASHRQGTFTVSLDDLIERFAMPAPNLIKVDVDGVEERIIAGAQHLLRRPELRSLLIEVYIFEQVGNRIAAAVEAAGLRLTNPAALEAPATAQNLIFVRDRVSNPDGGHAIPDGKFEEPDET